MKRILSTLLAALSGVLLSSSGPTAFAQQYPAKPVKMIVPYSPGGLPDTMARLVAQRLSESLKQGVIVENRPGAGGIVGSEAVAKAPPDGYTLLVADVGQLAVNPALYPKLPYDPVKDYAPVSMIGIAPLFLVAHESVPVKNLQELIALAKSKPGSLSYGSSGTGSQHHLSMEALKTALKLDIIHVPYKGTGQSVPALVGGQVQLAWAALPSLVAHVKSGKVRLLAANTETRSAQARDVPTVKEVTGIADYHYPGEIGALAPAATPKPIVSQLAAEIASAVKHRDTVEKFASLGIDPFANTSEEYAQKIKLDIDRFAKLVKAANVKLD